MTDHLRHDLLEITNTRWPVWEKTGTGGTITTWLTPDEVVPRVCWDHHDPERLAERLARQIVAAQMEAAE